MCYDVEPPALYDQRAVRARVAHACCECGGAIPAGATYERASGKWAGRFDAFATCRACAALRGEIAAREAREGCHGAEAAPPFGALWDAACEREIACPPWHRESHGDDGLADAGVF